MAANNQLYRVFEAVFKEHYNQLANYAFSILKNEQDAEDVVQEIFVKIWNNNPEVVATDHIKYYLITATRNGCISLLRRQASQPTINTDQVELQAAEDEER